MKPFRRIAFVFNQQKVGAQELTHELIEIARAAGATSKITGTRQLPRGYLKGCDVCCVIGGDGTLLGVVREAARQNIPVIGVNQGSLGFLTTFSAEEAQSQFAGLIAGNYRLSERTLLDCKTGPRRRDFALNDVVIKDEVNSQLVRLEVHADGKFVTDYNCDGLIFATPTGSTAYNLAAGGPIVHPKAKVISMTPICPHTLSDRTIIFRDQVKLRITSLSASSRVLVAMDGQRNLVATENSPIEITTAKHQLALVQAHDHSHFAVMRTKLRWTGGYLGNPAK